MSEWKKVKLGDVCQIIDGDRGKNYPKNHEFFGSGDCLFLNTGNVTKEGFSFANNQFITKEKDELLRKGKIQRGDLILTTRGTVGNIAYYTNHIKYENVRINSGMVILRVNKENVDASFLYQLVRSKESRTYINSFCTGSAQPQLPIKNLSQICFEIPSLSTQHRIATILSRYDSLIENYQKQIKLLEEAAQRLYKEWFVDLHFPDHENTKIINGVPEGWEKRKIEELVNIKSGYAFKSKDWQSKGHPVVKIKDINGTFVLSDSLDCVPITAAKKANQFILRTGDLVIAMTGATIGKVGIVTEDNIYTNQRVGKFFVKDRFILPFLYCYFKQKSTIDLVLKISSSSAAQPNISGSQLGSFVFMYNKELLDKYCDKVQYLFQKIIMLQKQARLLTEARDRLLQKLMSGEIEMKV